MNPVLIEPTDVLFFRDALPMSAGQGQGAGCRLPFPSTLHEAFRSTLLRLNAELVAGKRVEGRPRGAARSGNWHEAGHDGKTFIATKAFRSLRTLGPWPWRTGTGLLLPVPLEVARDSAGRLARLQLWRDPTVPALQQPGSPCQLQPVCLPVAVTPPDKHGQLHGWWTTAQMNDYLVGAQQRADNRFKPIPTEVLWAAEHRVGRVLPPSKVRKPLI